MVTPVLRRKRHPYSRTKINFELPNLIQIQRTSFEKFRSEGIRQTLGEISPIEDYTGSYAVEFGESHFEEPSFSVEECVSKDKTYSAPLFVRVRFIVKETGELREQDVFMGDFPLMTDSGTFIINGTERVVVTQLVRSPGAYVMEPKDPSKQVLTASLMPSRGSWLEFEVETKGYVSVRIDRKRKLPVTVLLKALDMGGPEELMARFEDSWLMRNTLERDDTASREDALLEVFRRQRPGEPVNIENAQNLVDGLFFDPKRYDLSEVGRYKVNKKLKLEVPKDTYTLTIEDIEALLKRLVEVAEGLAEEEEFGRINYERVRHKLDEYEHFGNRRLRTVGELVQEAFRIGMYRMERVVRERMTTQDVDTITPQSVVNTKPVASAIKEFFGSSQLSQFMDQTNTLSGLSHRRRLNAMGAGGLSRERAPIEVRDVHPTHYGRMCPIETPEGPNIGLIGQLSTFATVNEYGFVETPYRKVVDGVLTDEIEYLSADEEEEFTIAQANTPVEEGTGRILDSEQILARRRGGDVVSVSPEEIDYMDVAPLQTVSVGTALIPFLEHDDANRALMGANMQRQAVPLLRSQAPYVGTGMEFRAATDTGDVLIAHNAGTVERVVSEKITVREEDGETKEYRLRKFARSNQGTCVNQRPLVKEGEKIEAGTIIADGSSTDQGELALGKNLLVAFMPWEGFNFEDAIIISERIVKGDVLTSIHIEEYEVQARDTKLGPEEITRDIPNASDDVLMNLDSDGIIRIGAEVTSGDVLVGKVTPKGESEPTPEEKLLRAIFGEKAREVKDSSLKVPHGEGGVVIDVKRFNRDDGDELQPGVNEMVRVFVAKKRKIAEGDKLAGRHGNKGVISKIVPEEDMPFMEDGTPIDVILSPLGVPSRMNIGQILETHLGWAASQGLDGENGDEPSFVSTPVFSGAEVEDVNEAIEAARTNGGAQVGMGRGGKVTLYDGRTGEPFDGRITVGYMYILKLLHLVDDKIHARSTGPYSLVTQQPLGGKAQFGGQRFGEMEVWALEAYGAAHTLQELLTIKSDDRVGRVKSYESIVKGENIPEPGVPASFKVLLKEMQSLGLSVKPVYNAEAAAEDQDRRDWDEAARALGINLSREEPTGSLDDRPDTFAS
ncbi:MAG: DNA-directed RNA polymerase subunit beta [Actinomycetota bacterium]|nr:DNA-directed RNA polymerase subunit beta [Actinomycetota bacterium]